MDVQSKLLAGDPVGALEHYALEQKAEDVQYFVRYFHENAEYIYSDLPKLSALAAVFASSGAPEYTAVCELINGRLRLEFY